MARGIVDEIEQVSQYKGINAEIVLEAVKDAMVAAARRHYRTEEDLVAEINSTSGGIDVYAVKVVTDLVADPSREVSLAQARRHDPAARLGSEIRFKKSTRGMGHIAAQMAKQVIFQKIREAERERICAEFEGRVNTMDYCTVKRNEGRDVIVEVGRTEARMPRREQSRLESFMPGDRVRVVIKSVEKAGRGPAVIASRASEELVKRLFEQEVPEIYDKTVEIKACAREAGERTKIAVLSRDRQVDAVGACVGMKGMRVQAIIRELRGEKIDIIPYLDDPVDMVLSALSPAKVSRVNVLNPDMRHMEVIVDETQLSLAIGKKGQNVRLAAKLLGWRIDIKSEEEKRKEIEAAYAAMSGGGTPIILLLNHGLSAGLVEKLAESGATTVESLASRTPEQIMEIPGVGPELVERIRLAVTQCYAHLARTVGAVPADEERPPVADSLEGSDADQLDTAKAADTVLPGEPESGAQDGEEEDDLDFDVEELEGFGKMNRYRGPGLHAGFPSEGQDGGKSATDGASAAAAAAPDEAPAVAEAAAQPGTEEKNDSNQ